MRRRKGSIHPAVLPSFRRRGSGVRPIPEWTACPSSPSTFLLAKSVAETKTKREPLLRMAAADASRNGAQQRHLQRERVQLSTTELGMNRQCCAAAKAGAQHFSTCHALVVVQPSHNIGGIGSQALYRV